MTTEIAERRTGAPVDLIRVAVENGTDLIALEKVLELQERYEKNEARKSYHEAMAKFKENAPEILKDKKVSFGTTKYNHASLHNVTKKINAELSKWGLSSSWETAQDGDAIAVTCRITHKLGHSESTRLSAKADASGAKNAIQAIGSTVTYLERYTLLAMTGLATVDQDDDGNGTLVSFITDKQVKEIQGLIKEVGADAALFLTFMGVDSIDKIATTAYQKAVSALKAKKKAK